MKFSITGDTDSNTGLGLNKIWDYFNEIRKYFESKNYGTTVQGIGVCIVCVNPEFHKFKQRKRFDKKNKIIYHDIMLDFNLVIKMTYEQKMKLINHQLMVFIDEWEKRKFEDFDRRSFKKDMMEAVKMINYN